MIKPFKLNIPDKALQEIYTKVKNYPWHEMPDDGGWKYGSNLEYMKEISSYWIKDFDWRKHEVEINKFSNFTTAIDDIEIHFIHEKGSGSNPTPLLLMHGWPGSVVEFLHIIEKLAHPEKFGGNIEDAFDVIVPSLPGFGFSGRPSKPMGPRKIAAILNKLMIDKLEYKNYLAQGGDWGATITKWIAELFPENCIAIHLNLVLAFPGEGDDPMEGVTPEEAKGMENLQKYQETGFGYFAIQSTKPQTLGYGLNDSPVGLAGWIIEKFHGWAAKESNQLVVPLDEVLAIVSLYWFTESITSSARLYYENGPIGFSFNKINQPMAGAIFENEIARPPRAWAEKIYNIEQWNKYPGGHFAALENSEILASDIFSFAKKLKIL